MKSFLRTIQENWHVLVLLFMMIMWYSSVNFRLTAVEAKQADQQNLIDKVNQIQVDVSFIKGKIDKLK